MSYQITDRRSLSILAASVKALCQKAGIDIKDEDFKNTLVIIVLAQMMKLAATAILIMTGKEIEMIDARAESIINEALSKDEKKDI